MSAEDHNLDDLKDRLCSFSVEVRPDLQVRAEIIVQPEEGRWVFTPDELRDLAGGLESILSIQARKQDGRSGSRSSNTSDCLVPYSHNGQLKRDFADVSQSETEGGKDMVDVLIACVLLLRSPLAASILQPH